MELNSSTKYADDDGTWIKVISELGNVMQLKVNSPSNKQFDCCYFGPSTENQVSLLSEKIGRMLSDLDTFGLVVIGLDTEGKDLQLLQLSSTNSAVLVHIRSGLMNSEPIIKLLSNEYEKKVIFSGADIAGDALLLPIHGLLDLTPLLSPLYDERKTNPKKGAASNSKPTATTTECEESTTMMSLKRMYDTIFNKSWIKDNSITCSNWSSASLTLPQLKYAALDAWVSAVLGVYAIQEYATDGVLQRVFSTLHMSSQLRYTLRTLHDQSNDLEDLQRIDTTIKISNLRDDPRRNKRYLEAISGGYGNHLRGGGRVSITVYHPQGSADGVSIVGKTGSTNGKYSSIDLYPLDPKEGQAYRSNRYDTIIFNKLLSEPALFIANTWKEEDRRFGIYSQQHFNSPQEKLALWKQSMRIVITAISSEDPILRRVRWAIKSFIRAHIVPRSLLSNTATEGFPLPRVQEATSYEIAAESNMLTLLYVLSKDPVFSRGIQTLSTLAYDQDIAFFANILNQHQKQSVERALGHTISVITGPPGTGTQQYVCPSIYSMYICTCVYANCIYTM